MTRGSEPPKIGKYDVISIDSKLTLRKKRYLSTAFLHSAIYHAKAAREIEAEVRAREVPDREFNTKKSGEYFHSIAASIVTCAMFVESTINEILHDFMNNSGDAGSLASKDIRRVFSITGKRSLRLAATLERYELLAEVLGVSPVTKGTDPYQSVKLLIEVRNGLVHYQPSDEVVFTSMSDVDTSQRFEDSFRSRNIQTNPFAPKASLYFPDRLLSVDLAFFFIDSATEFVSVYLDSISLSRKAQHVRAIAEKLDA